MMMDVQIAWQLLAIWGIVGSTIIWFVRDERRLESEKVLARAARYYAHAPQFRHATRPEPAALPKPRSGAIRHADRAYFQRIMGIEPH